MFTSWCSVFVKGNPNWKRVMFLGKTKLIIFINGIAITWISLGSRFVEVILNRTDKKVSVLSMDHSVINALQYLAGILLQELLAFKVHNPRKFDIRWSSLIQTVNYVDIVNTIIMHQAMKGEVYLRDNLGVSYYQFLA